ncbi:MULTISPECIES: DUF2243 domain-containing protein [unclassified Arthrobacter]|uniref:DUF2243 domain-containing protein n=1 Tax=unclassified Arthrobacter TaxID=235627 RepID=UPI0027D857C4|nr:MULTISPECIES: DUF2243 domain-containing protein [unclassified Arthrobacter]
MADHPADGSRLKPPSKAAGVLYGLGLGGFIDGIVLHQILQWHHMVSHVDEFPVDAVHGLQVNTLVDGLFHLVAWVLVLAASISTIASWHSGRLAPNWRFHFGLVLMGWGIFNVAEGLVNHQFLQLHHVRDDLGGPILWDVGFLTFGVLLIVGGRLLHGVGLRSLNRFP